MPRKPTCSAPMPLPDPEPIYADAAAEITRQAEAAYQSTLAMIAEGVAAGIAVQRALDSFNGAYAGILAEAFSTLMQARYTPESMLAMPVGDVTLSQRLYAHTQQTANEVAAIVRQQAQGIVQARELALRLYDGYDPADGIKRPLEGRARAELPKALRALTEDTMTRRELSELIERGQQQSARIKSEALKAAYLQAFDKATDGLKEQAMRRALWVAEREKTRYMANRIAQTELKRAHTDAWAAEIMADEFVDVVQVKMNPRHPLPDICDVHARANLWGLGPGLYPKAKAPKPGYHPFCWCRLVTRPDLSAEKAREREGAVRELLRSMPAHEAARVLGSKERMAEVMNGGDWRKLSGLRIEPVGGGQNAWMRPHKDAIPNHESAVIPPAKLAGYSLNPAHDDGGADKARVFASVFGFTQENADVLAAKILGSLASAPSIERPSDKYGRRFQVDCFVTGPKGSGTVRTAWIIRPGTDFPSLTSAYVVKQKGST